MVGVTVQEKVLEARLAQSAQREVFAAFLARRTELSAEEDRLLKVSIQFIMFRTVLADRQIGCQVLLACFVWDCHLLFPLFSSGCWDILLCIEC